MRGEEREESLHGRGARETVRVEAARDDVEERCGVVSHAKPSHYELLEAGGRSSPRSEKSNARRDERKKNRRRTGAKAGGENC